MAKTAYRKSPLYKYHVQKADAKRRGIEFLLSFEQWWKIWLESGRWHERGAWRGQYVMSRPGDKGPYAVGNVQIVTNGANSIERNVRVGASAETRAAIAARNQTPEMRAVTVARNQLRVWTPEARERTGAATSARYADPEARRRASERQLAFLAREPEALAKQRAAAAARWADPEARQRAREKQLAYLARKRAECPT